MNSGAQAYNKKKRLIVNQQRMHLPPAGNKQNLKSTTAKNEKFSSNRYMINRSMFQRGLSGGANEDMQVAFA